LPINHYLRKCILLTLVRSTGYSSQPCIQWALAWLQHTERIGLHFCPASPNLDARQEAGARLAAVVRSSRIAGRSLVTEMPACLKQQGRQRYSLAAWMAGRNPAKQNGCDTRWGGRPIGGFLIASRETIGPFAAANANGYKFHIPHQRSNSNNFLASFKDVNSEHFFSTPPKTAEQTETPSHPPALYPSASAPGLRAGRETIAS